MRVPAPTLILARRHWSFLAVLVAGVVLRVVVWTTYHPAIFFADSFRYLDYLTSPSPDSQRPLGYAFLFLRPLTLGDLAAVPAAQHLLGLGMGLGIYLVALRFGARPWLATLAAAPVLLDGYQLQIEQVIASDSFFQTLVVAALAVLVWRSTPSTGAAAGAGLLFGLAATVRFVGVPVVVVPVLYLVARSGGDWRQRGIRVGALLGAAAVPLLVYSVWTYAQNGDFQPGGNSMSARTAYARTAPLANCAELRRGGAPGYLLRLCPDGSPAQRAQHPRSYMHETKYPGFVAGLPPDVGSYDALQRFSRAVFAQQPGDVLAAIMQDFGRGFWWERRNWRGEWSNHNWRFRLEADGSGARVRAKAEEAGFGRPAVSVATAPARFLRDYQGVVYARGPLLALGLVIPLVAAVRALVRRRHDGAMAAALLAGGAALILLLSAAAYAFSWRYQLPGIPLLPLAAVLGLLSLWPQAFKQRPAETLDEQQASDQAVEAFGATYGDVRLAPVVVVIAALDEAEAIGGVLDELPREVCGHQVDVLIVDDGSTDGTADVARAHGAFLARLPQTAGHGVALRVGYRLARELGARYIVTTDGDGQYDGADVPIVLEPVVDGTADLVLGSRRLGRDETTDPYRRAGVRFFAGLVSALTRQRLTDTSTGLRAMRAELTDVVPQRQRQYQTAELLIGAIACGYRVCERPTMMRPRAGGRSKKGHNALYGVRYAAVVIGTWLRSALWRSRRQGRGLVPSALSANTRRSNST